MNKQPSSVGPSGGTASASGGGLDSVASILARLEQGMTNISTELGTIKIELQSVKTENQNISTSIDLFRKEVKESVDSLKCNLRKANKQIVSLQKELTEAKIQLLNLQSSFNYTQQIVHYDGLRILNVNYNSDEDLLNIVKQIADFIDFNLDLSSIKSVYRLKTNTKLHYPPIILKFVNLQLKNKFFQLYKAKKGTLCLDSLGKSSTIRIFEEMSPSNYFLYKKARELKLNKVIKYVWFSRGRVLVRKEDNSPAAVIKSIADLANIKGEREMVEVYSDDGDDTDVSSLTSRISTDSKKRRRDQKHFTSQRGSLDNFLKPRSQALEPPK
uniref:FP protein C-terminal domain-containing protein n=1 Tax=Rhodnius prolixus TaxID=13249 RepID=T1HXY7_RHOPR